MTLVYGVDEAGRGPILGPMALAVVALDPVGTERLSALGVQDSKRFGAGEKAQEQRAALAVQIQQHAIAWTCELVPVEVIDEHTFRGQLNRLEQDVALRLLRQLAAAADAAIICDGARLFRPLRTHFSRLEAVDDGESAHVAVAAASILAKHARDTAFAEICSRYTADFGKIAGGGYANAATRRFLDAYARARGGLPPEARKSWGAEKHPVDAQLTLDVPVLPDMSSGPAQGLAKSDRSVRSLSSA
jgi:ribonuclease HII